jgi:hypothetical protein
VSQTVSKLRLAVLANRGTRISAVEACEILKLLSKIDDVIAENALLARSGATTQQRSNEQKDLT